MLIHLITLFVFCWHPHPLILFQCVIWIGLDWIGLHASWRAVILIWDIRIDKSLLYFAARNLATLNTLRGGYLWGGGSLGVIWGCLVWRQLCRGIDGTTYRPVPDVELRAADSGIVAALPLSAGVTTAYKIASRRRRVAINARESRRSIECVVPCRPQQTTSCVPTDCHLRAAGSDVQFHEFFWPWNISWNISEIFYKFHDVFFRLYTHPFNIFYTSNITFHSLMHTAAP